MDLELFHAPEAAGEARERLCSELHIDSHDGSRRHARAGIVNIVPARQMDACRNLLAVFLENDLGVLVVGREHLCHMHLRLGSMIPAARAAVATQVSIGHIVVDVLVLAADAVRRIGELVDPVVVDGRIDAKEHHWIRQHVMKRGAERVVRVHTERRVFGVFNADADVV